MPVVVTCPACQRKARIPRAALGKTVKCPSCASTFSATRGDDSLPAAPPVEADDSSELPSEPTPPAEDARRVERTGVGLLTISQGVFAISLALQLLVALLGLVSSDGGLGDSFLDSVSKVAAVVTVPGALTAVVAALVGAVLCAMPPGALPTRVAAVSILVLTLPTAVQMPTGSFHDLFSAMTVVSVVAAVYESARQVALAVYARSQGRQLGDASTAAMAAALAIAYPVAAIGLALLANLVGIFSSKPHPTFVPIVIILELLSKTVLVAWSAFVLWRVWDKMRPV